MPGINKIKVANVDYDITPIKYALEIVLTNPVTLALYDCATNQIISTDEHEINTILNEYVSNYNSKPYPTQIIYYKHDNYSSVATHIILTCRKNRDGAKFFTGESPRLNEYYKVSLDANFEYNGDIHEITVTMYQAISGYVSQSSTIGEVENGTLFLNDPSEYIDLGAYDTLSEMPLYPFAGLS